MVRSVGETAKVQIVQVKLFNEVRSIDYLELVTEKGEVIAKLLRRTTTDTTDYKLTFEAQFQPESQFTIPKDTDVRIVLRAIIRSASNAGFSDELLQVRTMSVTMKSEATNQTINASISGPFPKHQTAFGRITGVTRASPVTAPLIAGANTLIGTYSFSSSVLDGKNLKLRQLTFSLVKTGSVSVSNWTLVHRASGASVTCSTNDQTMTITCALLEQSVGAFTANTPLLLDLKATVFVPAGTNDSVLETSLDATGSPEALGSVEWTDESGIFRWIEGIAPVAKGTRLQ